MHAAIPIESQVDLDRVATDYRYDTFRAGLILNDARFSEASLKPGQVLPDRRLVRSDGEEISLRELAGGRPIALVTGSLTCPLSISALPLFGELNRLYGERVAFAFIYTREAHPGEDVNQPATLGEKVEHARLLKEIHGVDWPVLVDDMDGTLHRTLDTKQNSVHVFEVDGTLLARFCSGRCSPVMAPRKRLSSPSARKESLTEAKPSADSAAP